MDLWLGDRLRDLRVAATAYAVPETSPGSREAGAPSGQPAARVPQLGARTLPDCDALLVVDGAAGSWPAAVAG